MKEKVPPPRARKCDRGREKRRGGRRCMIFFMISLAFLNDLGHARTATGVAFLRRRGEKSNPTGVSPRRKRNNEKTSAAPLREPDNKRTVSGAYHFARTKQGGRGPKLLHTLQGRRGRHDAKESAVKREIAVTYLRNTNYQ